MGWNNPPMTWPEFESTLSGRRKPNPGKGKGDGGDSPAWSRKRGPYQRPPLDPAQAAAKASTAVVPYAELHAHSNYSFLDGSSSPEQLVEEAVRLGLHALALTDHDGFYGIVRMAEAAEAYSLKTVFGAELSLGLSKPQHGEADPEGEHLLVLARKEEGYHRLAAAMTAAHLAADSEKGRPIYDLDAVSESLRGHCLVLTGCRKGAVRRALLREGEHAAAREVDALIERFGQGNVVVELFDHGNPLDSSHNDALARIADQAGIPVIASNAVHYAAPAGYPLATAMAAVRARRSLDELDGWLPANSGAHLRSGSEMAARFARYPGAVERTVEIADELAFQLRAARPKLPKLDVPPGHSLNSWLRSLVSEGIKDKYPDADERVHRRIEQELAVIEAKDFPGYFLIVHDIVQFARSRGILCQGRGSAANSAVCYALGITAVDSIFYNLPFERFLSSLREEEPDIDVDFDSDRREEVIQYVYGKYGRFNAAQVANVISYRPKNAVRDVAKALGYSQGQQDAWSKRLDHWGDLSDGKAHNIPEPVLKLAEQIMGAPRHLGIHSGGMVLTERPVGEVVPIERARMDNRTVLQWDKDDCEWMGLVKFDLLGLGMLAALQYSFDLIDNNFGERWTIESIPREEQAVYDMLCRADSIGVFQVESRAQISTLPRLKPREYYDLVVEIALIRPGPVQGGAVHPYIRRRAGTEKITYLHPLLEPVLKRTKGVPLFQEQLMQMAVAVGGCTAEDADLLRRAMGSKRGREKIESLEAKLYAGMAANGISKDDADAIYAKIQAFANFGFAESHSLSFAVLVYASSWLKLHYPGAFLAALLRAQPMGFYSPQSLVADARRHGVQVLRPDILSSRAEATLEKIDDPKERDQGGMDSCLEFHQPPIGPFLQDQPREDHLHRRDGSHAVRLGLDGVTSIGAEVAKRIVAERDQNGPFRDLGDLSRRADLSAEQLEALASAGALDSLGMNRREALWQAGDAALEREGQLPGTHVPVQPPLLPELSPQENVAYDMWATGISTDDHPMRYARGRLDSRGVLRVDRLAQVRSGTRVEVAGVVTHRQRPQTAQGITFVNLEDESGILNVICSIGLWKRHRRVARESSALIVRGFLERTQEGVTNLVADKLEPLVLTVKSASRDFR
ncbi:MULTISPECIES: error-prone DNA polymerase [Arthrobacter]|uniref:Error-prone DNA polymerase n=1 Tax=Arthrobacter terricola TaxID=2547396 RepID=A0A4R5KVK2_9MICC|nr:MULTISPECIES: error-prone DNA polymerase [Arthrobacter]MBT8160306.1 error-prone DNA polymerase [Arthrobacter sp. GN70]TDF99993.1 error-prone DNA polymerase [Arthrobacter terricola]